MDKTYRLCVLISGSGSNLQAMIDDAKQSSQSIDIVRVISNRRDAYGLTRAKQAQIPTQTVCLSDFNDRDAFDDALGKYIDETQADLIVLAGFMHILPARIVQAYAGRMINIHPSLLPAYPGLRTHQQVLANKATQHGVTVHFVIPALDAGQIIAQGYFDVASTDDVISLNQRCQTIEHILLPNVINWLANKRLIYTDGQWAFDKKTLFDSLLRFSESELLKNKHENAYKLI